MKHNPPPLLSVRDVSFSYSRRKVLDGVCFDAYPGEALALLGKNGAGKTTLFRLILGFVNKYSGVVALDGKDCDAYSPRERARKIAYIPQLQPQAFNYRVLLAVLMGRNALVGGLRGPALRDEEAAFAALDTLGIAHLADCGFAEISGGERALVLFARALASEARVFIMDEPTANLDYGNQIRALQKIRALADSGYLVIFSTHHPEHALRFADRVLVLDGGAALAAGDPREVLTPALLEHVYGVRSIVQEISVEEQRVSVCVPLL